MKGFKNIFLILALIAACYGCKHEKAHTFSDIPILQQEAPEIHADIELEKIKLDSANCSGEFFSGTTPGGNIYLMDKYFGWLYEFTPDGKLLGRHIGLGKGPKETQIRNGIYSAMSPEGDLAMCGTSLNFEIFSSSNDYKRTKSFFVFYKEGVSTPNDFMTYSNAAGTRTARLLNGKLYQGKTSENLYFNYITNTGKYLEESYRISVIDTETGKALPMVLKGFPAVYKEHPSRYTAFQCVTFDFVGDDKSYVSFEADSLIYICDKSFNPIAAFGSAGRDMDLSYKKISTPLARKTYKENRKTKGYYSWLEFIDETQTCFRSYAKGAHSQCDGLQIYQNEKLLGDNDVPKGMKITGYISPYYYSQVYFEEDSGQLYIYRFKL